MKATEAGLLTFLQKSTQFIIPIYQRTYSWTDKECRQLWDDIIRAGKNEAIPVHFIGSIVYVEQGLSQVTHQSPVLVIDGQQRLTTVTLLLEALARALDDTEPVEGFSAKKLRHYYLTNPLESGDRYFKLLLSQTDSASLKAVVRNSPAPKEPSIRVEQCFQHFTNWIAEREGDLEPVCRGLAKLVVVDIALNREQDNPQLIFESMNSTGKELSQADLIRNFILMGLEPELQTRLYEEYWRPMELDFGQAAYGTHFDAFMRHYLTMKTSEIPRERDVYDAFKNYSRSAPVVAGGIGELVKDLRTFAGYYCAMALGSERDSDLGLAFQDLRELRVDVAYPFLLEIYHDYASGLLSHQDMLSVVRMVEAYVFRRAVCNIPTNSLNKTFSAFGRALSKDRYVESIKAQFLLMPSYRRFPSNEEFIRGIKTRNLYQFRTRSYWLRRMENHGRKERVPVDEYTIEHIMPQNPNLSDAWQQALGPDWQRVQEQWLHTLGNLTLTGYNSEYSDNPFPQKRDMEGGFRESPIRLNAGLGTLDTWNEQAIVARAERLAALAVDVWPAPALSAEVLQEFKPPEEIQPEVYTIDDHPHLLSSHLRPLFEAFRKAVLALDPCVTEKFLKYYVAYKAETNFVDVIPQARRLRLTLNIPFPEIDDPKRHCEDITNVSRWSNGDVATELKSLEDLPYVIGLVRQALEHQMGNGDEH